MYWKEVGAAIPDQSDKRLPKPQGISALHVYYIIEQMPLTRTEGNHERKRRINRQNHDARS